MLQSDRLERLAHTPPPEGTVAQKKQAAGALKNCAVDNPANRDVVRDAGGIGVLVGRIGRAEAKPGPLAVADEVRPAPAPFAQILHAARKVRRTHTRMHARARTCTCSLSLSLGPAVSCL